jgi:hypothetical protein
MVWRVVSVTLLLAVSGWAQAPGDAQQGVSLRSPFANPLRAAVKPVTPESNTEAQKPPAATAKPAEGAAVAPSGAQPAKASPSTVKAVGGGRDPFISPISQASAAAAVCTSGGKRCLMIDRIRLKGVVRSESGFIAVVVNTANRAYFLRENDPLMNGYVLRVTSNTITFKETSKDRAGHPTAREVTLTLSGPAV